MDKPFEFCRALDRLHVRYGVLIARDDAAMVTVVVPGQSQGVEGASGADLDHLIEAFRS